MKRAQEDEQECIQQIGSVEDVMKEIVKAQFPRLKLRHWTDCRILVRQRLVSQMFLRIVDSVLPSIRFLSREMMLNMDYSDVVEFENLEKFCNASLHPFIPLFNNLKTLDLKGACGVRDEQISHLTRLETLQLYGHGGMTDKCITTLTNLTKLRIGANHGITEHGLLTLGKLKCLKTAVNHHFPQLHKLTNLTSLKLATHSMDNWWHGMTQLKSLTLKSGKPLGIDTISSLPNLTSLSLQTISQLESVADDQCKRLLKLVIRFNSNESVQKISRLENLQSLRISVENGSQLDILESLTKLTTLSISAVYIGNPESWLNNLTNLRKLTLCCSSHLILFHLTHLSNLEELNLRRVDFGRQDEKRLDILMPLKENLRILSFPDDQPGEDYRKVVHYKKLRKLVLYKCKREIDESGIIIKKK